MNKHTLTSVLIILIGINLILSALIVYGQYTGNYFCVTGQSCFIVQTSQYAQILGLEVSWLGVIAFSVLLILSILNLYNKLKFKYLLILITIGTLLAIYFLIIQFSVLKQTCSQCLPIDILMLIIFAVALFLNKKKDQ